MSRDRDDELADLLGELADTLRRLEAEVGPDRPRRGPFGLPPPPSPRDVMRFTGEYAIPTAIAVLEVNVRILELVGAALRAGATAEESRQRRGEVADRLRGETVSQLERALAEIQRAVEEGNLPQTPEVREIVEEARRLNADIREYVREADETVEDERQAERRVERRPERWSERGTSIPIDGGDEGEDAEDGGVEIDVEEELESIKEGMANDGDDAGDEDEDEASDAGNEGHDAEDDDAEADGNDAEDDGNQDRDSGE